MNNPDEPSPYVVLYSVDRAVRRAFISPRIFWRRSFLAYRVNLLLILQSI